ncbi:MAG: hypothetical protein ABI591_07715 [Kofleriaceae bacterium]
MRRCMVVVMLLATTARTQPMPADAPETLDHLLSRTDEIAHQVAKVRGLRLKHPVPYEVVDRAELRKRLIAEAAEDKTTAETAAEGLAVQRWGFVPLDYDYGARLLDLLSDQIAGYYDPKTKKLTVLDTAADDPDWASMVLTHELDHGLQDQAFDLEKFEKLPDDESDAALARHALVEGDGVTLMLEMSLAHEGANHPWQEPAVAAAVIASMNAPPADEAKDLMSQAPLALREAMLFPYRDGFAFVSALRRTKPWSAIDAAFKRPPRSTEQILHVDKYLSDDKPIPVVAGSSPLAGFTVFDTEVWGELGIRSFLRTFGVSDDVSNRAAAGWGGDRAVVLAHEGETNPRKMIGVARFEWDTEIDAREAQAALEHALDAMTVGATMVQTMERTRWLGLDGTVSWIERKGSALVMVIGAPLAHADKLDAWTFLRRGR